MKPLDPRAARTDLTDRECTRILGGVLGPLVQMAGTGEIRAGLRIAIPMYRHLCCGEPEPSPPAKVTAAQYEACLLILGLATGLAELSPPETVADALNWWRDKDAAWEALAELPRIGAPRPN